MKHFLVILCLFKAFSVYSQSDESLPAIAADKGIPNMFFERTVQLRIDGSTVSGVLHVGKDSVIHIITALHLFKDRIRKLKNGDTCTITMYHEDSWKTAHGHVFYKDTLTDIAVIKLYQKLPQRPHQIWESRTVLGQDMAFLGYPLNFQTIATNKIFAHPLPLVNKGIFSGFNSANGNDLLFISANNTYGYSGGPVIYYNYYRNKWEIIGIVGGYINQMNVIERNNGKKDTTYENSGLMYATDIKQVLAIKGLNL
ncbi:serine protease [Danxiaibacter flavus]|uniref:Serine protease n=1 Tax=Danxiaibacter flavus TaxID=3049108 RepID=A0ABV3ZLA3_9BACT|nr:serine protease [Chitinophagaceae bacterium DXS]